MPAAPAQLPKSDECKQKCRHAGIEVANDLAGTLVGGQGDANTEWQNDVDGLTAVYEAMISVPEPSSILFETAGPQVRQIACKSHDQQHCQVRTLTRALGESGNMSTEQTLTCLCGQQRQPPM